MGGVLNPPLSTQYQSVMHWHTQVVQEMKMKIEEMKVGTTE